MSEQGPTVFNGRYALLRHVARGGMADVYAARDALLDRQVALKVLFSEYAEDQNFVERFRREAQAAANLNHPNIVGIYDWGQEQGIYYIVMEYVKGRSMAEVLRSTGPLNPDRAAEITAEVADALGAAHGAGLVHRDVKLGNILVSDDGIVKVADFGIARGLAGSTSDNLTRVDSVVGTATYFSPEQAQGKTLDGRSDLYSLGVVLYEMVTGKPPFTAETPMAVALEHVRERPVPPNQNGANIAASLEAIILKLLAKNPSRRYPTAGDLAADLRLYRAGVHQLPSPPARPVSSTGAGYPVAARPAPPARPVSSTGAGYPVAARPAPPARPVSSAGAGYPVAARPAPPARPASVPAVHFPSTSSGSARSSAPPARPQPAPGGPVAPQYTPDYYYGSHPGDGWKRTALMLVLLAGLIALLGYLVVRFYQSLGLGEDDAPPPIEKEEVISTVEVPVLTDLGLIEAQTQLQELGLDIVVEYQVNTVLAENTVFGQSPPAGQRVDEGEPVTLTVSRLETPTVPPVRGRSRDQAEQRLEELGYVPIVITVTHAAQAGTVVDQTPVSGTELPVGEAVTIDVSLGPGQIFVPDVSRLTQIEAFSVLTDSGFRVEQKQQASETVESGLVVETDPPAGETLRPNSVVTVVVSTGLPTVQVPDVVGLLFDTGRLTLEGAGLTINPVFEPVEEDRDIGRVLAQSPPPGLEVEQGEQVEVVVGQPPTVEPTTTVEPDTTTTTAEPATTTTTAGPATTTTTAGPATTTTTAEPTPTVDPSIDSSEG